MSSPASSCTPSTWPDLPRQPVAPTPGRPNPTICGRRFCACCGRWRHLIDFPPKYDHETRQHRPFPRCVVCRAVTKHVSERNRRLRPKDEYDPRTTQAESVPAGPFLEWLDRWQAKQQNWFDGSSTGAVDSLNSLANRAGVASRTIRRARKTGRISFDSVDRYLIAAGGETMLWELFESSPAWDAFYKGCSSPANTECWPWVGPGHGPGYGGAIVNGQRVYAHRLSYELHKGEIPDGLEIDHVCSNKLCVNPAHLEAVSHAENIRRWRERTVKACPAGHVYDDENTRIDNRGHRYCATCSKEKTRARRAKAKATD